VLLVEFSVLASDHHLTHTSKTGQEYSMVVQFKTLLTCKLEGECKCYSTCEEYNHVGTSDRVKVGLVNLSIRHVGCAALFFFCRGRNMMEAAGKRRLRTPE
jgi:hypothetical protein